VNTSGGRKELFSGKGGTDAILGLCQSDRESSGESIQKHGSQGLCHAIKGANILLPNWRKKKGKLVNVGKNHSRWGPSAAAIALMKEKSSCPLGKDTGEGPKSGSIKKRGGPLEEEH